MAEKKGVGHAYNVDFLNVVFAASSLFLFLSVIWMVWDDYNRDWKNTQRRFAELQYQVTRAQLQQANRAIDPTPRLLILCAGHLVLQVREVPLRLLPVPVVVVPDHPNDRQEQEQAGRRENDVQEVDVVGVPDTLLFSHDSGLKAIKY